MIKKVGSGETVLLIINTANPAKPIIAFFLAISIICSAFAMLAATNENASDIIGHEPSGAQEFDVRQTTTRAPDAFANTRANCCSTGVRLFRAFTGRSNNTRGFMFVMFLPLALTYASVGMLPQGKRDVEGIRLLCLPVLAFSLGGNSPPVIRA